MDREYKHIPLEIVKKSLSLQGISQVVFGETLNRRAVGSPPPTVSPITRHTIRNVLVCVDHNAQSQISLMRIRPQERPPCLKIRLVVESFHQSMSVDPNQVSVTAGGPEQNPIPGCHRGAAGLERKRRQSMNCLAI